MESEAQLSMSARQTCIETRDHAPVDVNMEADGKAHSAEYNVTTLTKCVIEAFEPREKSQGSGGKERERSARR